MLNQLLTSPLEGKCTLKVCPHLNWIRSTSISHFNPLRMKPDQSTSYETRLLHFDHVLTTNLTRCDRAQCPLFVHVIGCAFFNKSSRSAEMLFWLLLYLLLCLHEKKTTKSFGSGTLDHKESRKEMEVASGSEKVAKVRIVVSINMCSVWDSIYCHG